MDRATKHTSSAATTSSRATKSLWGLVRPIGYRIRVKRVVRLALSVIGDLAELGRGTVEDFQTASGTSQETT